MKEKILSWMLTGRVGASSKAMAAHLSGVPCDGSFPHDPADLNRCLLFLEAVPEARAELPRMATVNKVWAALVARWDEIEASFLSEVGRDWCKALSAPKTYRMMREVISSANARTHAKVGLRIVWRGNSGGIITAVEPRAAGGPLVSVRMDDGTEMHGLTVGEWDVDANDGITGGGTPYRGCTGSTGDPV